MGWRAGPRGAVTNGRPFLALTYSA
jgi:hypothetical protein